MDVKRNRSEMTRTIRAPFGEDYDLSAEEDEQDDYLNKNFKQLNKFIQELETIPELHKTDKKVIKG